MNKTIPYSRQSIDEEDVAAVVSVLHSDYLTQGPAVEWFETALTSYTGAEYAVVFSSGTAALHAAYFAAGLSAGDELITSPITFVATSNAALYCRAHPIFADVEGDTGNVDVARIEENITERTKVIVPVHYAGHPVEMGKVHSVAQKYGLMVIEDACHALGARYRIDDVTGKNGGTKREQEEWNQIGSCAHSNMTVLSFHPVKHITTGEGGAVLTNDEQVWESLLMFRTHGITKNKVDFRGSGCADQGDWYYEMQFLGYNYRMTDIQAALGCSQLTKIERFVEARRHIAAVFNAAFKDNPYFDLPAEHSCARSSYHLYTIRLKDYLADKRRTVFSCLRETGLGVQVLYIPVYLQPYYRNLGYAEGLCPVAEDFYSRAISIPIHQTMTQEDQGMVIQKVLSVLEEVDNR